MVVMTFCSCSIIKSDDSDKKSKTTVSEDADSEDIEKQKTAKGSKDGSGDADESTKENSDEKDSDGSGKSTTIYVLDDNGEIVTDKNGNKVTEVYNEEKASKKLEEALKKQEGNSSEALPEGQKANNTTLVKTKVEPVLKSGTYTIKGEITVEGTTMKATIAFRNSGKDFSISASVMGMAVKIFSSNGKYYMAVPMLNKYTEISKDEIGDMTEFTDAFKASDAKYVKTTTVKDGKKTFTCEEYSIDDGTLKYYFNEKGEWKRLEMIQDDYSVIWEIDTFSNKADDSLFAPSKGMKQDNNLFEGFM